MAKYRIENVVASTSLGEELDLKAIAHVLGGAEYEPEQFPGLIYRIKDPKTATLLFRSGKVVCTGAKSLEHVKIAIDLVSKQIQAAGITVKKNPEIEVQNIVATSDLGAQIDLNAVAITLGLGQVESEPGAVPRPRLPHREARGRPSPIRQREARLHGRPQALRCGRGRREGHGRVPGQRAPALSHVTDAGMQEGVPCFACEALITQGTVAPRVWRRPR